MQNRESLYPGRIQLDPVPGTTNIYDVTPADEPIVAGTPFNKETMLTDATAALLDLGNDATVDDVLSLLINRLNTLNNNVTTLNQTVQTLNSKLADKVTGGTADLTAGSSTLESGTLYVVYK